MAGKLDGLFGSMQFGSFINYGYYIILLIIICVVGIVISYFVLMILKYKHRVRILEVVGDSLQESKDRGALLKDSKTKKAFEFKLLKGKVELPPPPADAYIMDKRGKKILYVAKISPTDYIYAKPSHDLTKKEANLIPIDQDTLFWYVNKMEHQNEKYRHDMKWYQNPVVMFWGTLGITLVILILTFKFAGQANASWQATAASTANQIINAAKSSVGQVVT